MRGSLEPMKVTSLPAGSNTRSAKNKSASVVSDETQSFAATGPVISRFLVIGGVIKVLVLTSNLSHMSMRAELRADAAKVMARLRQAVDYPLVTPA